MDIKIAKIAYTEGILATITFATSCFLVKNTNKFEVDSLRND